MYNFLYLVCLGIFTRTATVCVCSFKKKKKKHDNRSDLHPNVVFFYLFFLFIVLQDNCDKAKH